MEFLSDIGHKAAAALASAASATAFELGVLLGPGLVLAIAVSLTSFLVLRAALGVFGARIFLALFGWLGTAVHELGHALFCVVFRHRITEMRLFDPEAEGGSLGYVRHTFDPRNPWHLVGNLFIGIGPILLGAALLAFAAKLLLGASVHVAPLDPAALAPVFAGDMAGLWRSLLHVLEDAAASLAFSFRPDLLGDWRFYLFVYLTLSIGALMSLSASDLKGAGAGLLAVAALAVGANLIAERAFGASLVDAAVATGSALGFGYAVLLLVGAVNLAMAALLFLLSLVVPKRRGSEAAP